ncbi:phage portal protein (plasmid) [Streptomyces sp. BI20]|uniref:phage portal protein n=1 Tax=Streptomyces sp. BI20 TaxID=3403460 RepID=UPI003C715B5A
MATELEALRLVAILENELENRRGPADRFERYYESDQPLAFASETFRKNFGKQYEGFADNWTQVVADSPVERMTVTGVKPAGTDKADDELWGVWQANNLDCDSQLGFLGSAVGSRSFVYVWGNDADPDVPTVQFLDTTEAVVAYVPGSRYERRAALRVFQDGDHECATLYLPDERWRFRRVLRRQAKSAQMAEADTEMDLWLPPSEKARQDAEHAWATVAGAEPNPMGCVPIIELPNRPRLVRDPISDIAGVAAMQDAVNLLWAQLFTTSDFASFPQRVVMGMERPKIPILDKDGQKIGERPMDLAKFAVDRLLWLEDPNTKISEWQAARLDVYTGVLEVAVGHIAAQTRTPQHYLVGKMANLSGDALIAAEAGLVKKCGEKQLWWGAAVREMFRLVALAMNNAKKAKAIRSGTLLWADTESRSRTQLADALVKLRQVGFPFAYLAAHYGLSPSEVADLVAMREKEADLDPLAQMVNPKPLGGPEERTAPAAEAQDDEDQEQDEGQEPDAPAPARRRRRVPVGARR